jgi:hypothetical protein
MRIGDRVHQRPRQVHQPAAPQDAIGEFENMQADRIAASRLVVADKAFSLQGSQDVVGGPAMKSRGAGDLARIQRPLRRVQGAQDLGGCDDRAHRLAAAKITGDDLLAARAGRLDFKALGVEVAGC